MQSFLHDPHSDDLGARLVEWLAIPRAPDYQPWALVDMSMLDAGVLGRLERLTGASVALLDGSRYAAYEELGPRLIPLSSISPPAIERFVAHFSGRPALSFVELPTCERSPDLAGLARLAEAETSDGLQLYCRFSDTRILPNVLQALDPQQTERLARTVRRWAWIGRDGHLQSSKFAEKTSKRASESDEPFQLSDAQFSALMQAAECDTLHQLLCDISPEIIPDLPGSAIHRKLDRLLSVARDYGITEAPDQLQFVTIAWSSSEHFHELSSLSSTWNTTRSAKQRFGEAVKDWSDEIWDEIESMANN